MFLRCYSLNWQFFFLVTIACAVSSHAQEPEAPTSRKAQKAISFPADWLGLWSGEATNVDPSGNQQAFSMQLEIAATEKSDRFQWRMVYEGVQGKSERNYSLVVKDAENGKYAIDENNGIELDAILLGDTLVESFFIQGQRIWTTFKFVQSEAGREIHFDLFSADDSQIRKSGARDGVPEVTSWRANSRQFAKLLLNSKKETKPAVDAFQWTKLETEEYRGKQDDIFFINEQIGWYVNGAGKIFKTVDSGATWVLQLHQPGTYFRCIAFVDELRGFAGNIGPDYFPNVSDSVPLYETHDGGATWTAVTAIEGPPVIGLCALQVMREPFVNAGVLETRVRILGVGRVGGPAAMIQSDDLGKTWQQVDLPKDAAMAFDVHFFNRNEGIIATASHADVSQSNALILSTSDGGKTWQKAWQSPRTFELTWKISFPNRKTGYVTIQSYNPDPKVIERFVAKTIDGGKSWAELPLINDPKVREFGIAFLDSETGWVGAVPNGFQTTDGGKTWTAVKMGNAVNKIRWIESDENHIGFAIGSQVHRLVIPKLAK